MRNPVSAAFNSLATRSMRNERAWVEEPHRARRLMLHDLVLFIIVITASVLDDWLPSDSLLDTAALLIVATYVGWGAFQTTRKMSAYRSGWLDGRSAMMSALSEAHRRGMEPREWAEAELARDLSIMGIMPKQPPPPDGSHDDI